MAFEVYPIQSQDYGTDWTSLVYVGTGNAPGQNGYGSHTPSIWYRPYDQSIRFQSAVNSDHQHSYTHQLGQQGQQQGQQGQQQGQQGQQQGQQQWQNIQVSQQQNQAGDYIYSIQIDGQTVHTVTNNDARRFENINSYSGDPYSVPAPCWIRQFTVQSSQGHVRYEECNNFSQCSVSCGGGTQTCSRRCVGGQVGEEGCDAQNEIRSQQCNQEQCKPWQWKTVYSQTKELDFRSNCNLQQCSYQVDSDNFIEFNGLNSRSSYHFRFRWTFQDGSTEMMQWTQTQSPLSQTNTNMNPTKTSHSKGVSVMNFSRGLSISSSQGVLLDGGSQGYYSIGYESTVSQYAYQLTGSSPVGLAQKTELMLDMEATGKINIFIFF